MNVRLALMLISDALLAWAALTTAVVLRLGVQPLGRQLLEGRALKVAATFIAVSLFATYLVELYAPARRSSKWEIFIKCLQGGCASSFLLSLIYYLHPVRLLGSGVLFIAIETFCCYQYLWHVISRSGKNQPSFAKRVLILGTDQVAFELAEMVAANDLFTLAGFLECPPERTTGRSRMQGRLLEWQGDLLNTSRGQQVDVIVVALSERRGVLPLQEIMQCKLSGVEVLDAATCYELLQGKLMLERITPTWVVFSSGFSGSPLVAFLKRCIDLTLSLLGMVLAAPFFPLLALAIKAAAPGPVILSRFRVGDSERPFRMYSFRTGREATAAEEGEPFDDGRLTPVGRWLRRWGVEQIPQLYNVLKGEMSLVGPRPERPEFVEMLKKDISFYSKRHTIKPGITGWAQVNHPQGTSLEDALEKLRYDLYYIKNISASLDSQIMFETVKVALFGRGRR